MKRNRIHCLLLWGLASGSIAGCGWEGDAQQNEWRVLPPPPISPRVWEPQVVAEVNAFCGDCHIAPDPTTFPRGRWAEEVERGFGFYEESGRHDLHPPPRELVVQFYQARAPESLPLPPPVRDTNTSPVRFRRVDIPWPGGGRSRPSVSHLRSHPTGLYVCDMNSGIVGDISFQQLQPVSRELVRVQVAGHIEEATLEPEGHTGWLIAQMGSVGPEDHDRGAVLFQPVNLQEPQWTVADRLGRVADVQAGDFNGDGATDVAIADFGWHRSGGLHIALQRLGGAAPPTRFAVQTIDPRHGASHLHVRDLDGDGDLDLVALHSQEYETVTAYINDGGANFTTRTLFAAPVPDFGCSSLEMADLDGDGDEDLVLTNGDSMDSFLLKPHHGVQWLENRGGLDFQYHLIARQGGVYGAAVGDLDGDGDLDIAACAMTWKQEDHNPLVWFEQTERGAFTLHALTFSNDQHACIELGDWDRDGDLDIAVGEFDMYIALPYLGSIWWNEGPRLDGD
ncbi:MAG: VCBS repeat-containing protein [Planctomycetota bacterium]|nr:MAG: VCBS repeat-containing protein [Planctomycetota bacterium]